MQEGIEKEKKLEQQMSTYLKEKVEHDKEHYLSLIHI